MTARVLIVDDIEANVKLLEARLTAEYFETLTARSGPEALEICSTEGADVVLLDIMMPVMDGYETIKRIRDQKEFQQLPIIALTAKAMKEDRDKCIAAGANDYLSKPVDLDRLFSVMRVWLYR